VTFTGTGRLRFNHAMSETSDIERLWRLGDLVSPMAVRVAATLRLSDHIAAGATTLPDLAERTDSHPETLGRLMRHLVAIGVYSGTGERYSLTGVGEAMREGHAGNRGPLMLDLTSAVGRAHLAAVRLLESVRTGGPAYPLVHGRGFWDDLSLDAELGAGFSLELEAGIDAPLVHRQFFTTTPLETVAETPPVSLLVGIGLSRRL